MTGDYLTLIEFIREKGLPVETSSWPYRKMTGWVQEKKNKREKALEKAEDRDIQKEFDNVPQVRERHARLARFLQVKGLKELESLDSRNVDEARKLVTAGLQEERVSLGMTDSSGGRGPMTQVNINLPRTRFDDMLEEMNYEQLVKFIAELKQIGAGSSVQEGIVEGTSEIRDGEAV